MKTAALKHFTIANTWTLKLQELGHGQRHVLVQERRVKMQEIGIHKEFIQVVNT